MSEVRPLSAISISLCVHRTGPIPTDVLQNIADKSLVCFKSDKDALGVTLRPLLGSTG